jgi:putative FmdB family regulatory protein
VPMFDFHCPDCNKTAGLLVGHSELPVCPQCGGTRLEKQIARLAPPGRSAGIMRSARAQAGREGHLSNFGPGEK